MTSARPRLRRTSGLTSRFGAAALVAGTLALLLPPAASAAPATAATAALRAQIVLTSVSPAAVTPKDALVVAGRVTNAGTAPLPGLRLGLRLDGRLLEDRDAVRAWTVRGQVDDAGRLPGTADVGPLAPGATAAFTITVPAGRLGLPRARNQFGPRGVAIEATTAGSGQRAGVTRTTIVWYPGKEFQPTRLTLLAPVTAPRGTDVSAPSAELAAAMAPGGSLQRTLAATDDPLIGWALDPALLAAARTLTGADGATGATATPTPTTGAGTPTPTPSATTNPAQQQAATQWLGALTAGLEGRDVVTLPFGDPDLAALSRAGAGTMLRAADRLAADATRETLGTALAPDVAWPAGGAADASTLQALQRNGRRAVILGSATQPLVEPVDHTSTGRSTVPAGRGAMAGLLYDEQLSSLFGATGGPRAAAATQQLVAELAAITLERPGDPRHVLAVVPRGWTPDPRGVEAAMTALRTTPWITLRTLDDLRGTRPAAARVAPRYTPANIAAELPPGHVAAVAGLFGDVTRFAPALVDPEPVVDPILEQCLMLVSAAWRRDRLELGAARAPVAREVHDLVGGVHIVRGSSRPYFLASEAALPVYVANGTPYPVHVVVTLRPRSGGLVIEKPVEVDLAPNTRRQQVLVPTKALASGDVQIAATVRTPAGAVIGEERELVVRVRREWETRGIIGVGTLLVLLLAVGLLRGVRRGRTRVRPEDVPDVDDLASAAGDRAAARRDAIEEAAREDGGGPAAEPVIEPVIEPAAEPVTEPAAEPVTEPAAEPVTEPAGEPITESDRAAGDDVSGQDGQSGRAVASPDSAEGDVTDLDDARDRPVMSREHR